MTPEPRTSEPRTPEPGVLTLVAPRRGKPPRHLADLGMSERREWLTELGESAFRADQLSRHYFERLVDDPHAMTDLPADGRAELVSTVLPTLQTPVRTLTCDDGATVKNVVRLNDGSLVESVLMRY
ncbi:MAG TPA: 23S rRNA (adenine(2503)-C(2))-methyltransferase RlmN, partial [Actinomycetes bacterium]|nr:23S rRNA (adenine(2503)-C(2))-methyltransferase RlmN [Actinomycetes bacterium]